MSFPTARRVIDVALSQVGTTEDPPGSNHTKYNAAYGAYSQGWAWCGIFIHWIFNEAGVDLRKTGIRNPQYTPSFFQEAAKAGWKVVHGDAIRPGDVLFFDFEAPFNTHGIQHVELATSRPAGGRVRTVGGNTSSGVGGSQDNGGGVFARDRPLSVIVAAVRPPYTTKATGKTTRVVVVGAAVAGAGAAVGTVATHPPTPAPKPSPSVTVTKVPAPHPTPTAIPRPPRRATPAPRIRGPLRYGSTGESVKALQRHLHVTPTGYFGRITLRKVKAVQAAADLTQDGIVGPRTARAMGFQYATK